VVSTGSAAAFVASVVGEAAGFEFVHADNKRLKLSNATINRIAVLLTFIVISPLNKIIC
jgi:hypothetical protein